MKGDQVTSVQRDGKIVNLVIKTTVNGKPFKLIVDRPIGADEYTCLRDGIFRTHKVK
jgi:hypothetical protein